MKIGSKLRFKSEVPHIELTNFMPGDQGVHIHDNMNHFRVSINGYECLMSEMAINELFDEIQLQPTSPVEVKETIAKKVERVIKKTMTRRVKK